MNSAMQAFTPAACWPAALGILGIAKEDIPDDATKGTTVLALMLTTTPKSLRDLAQETAETLKEQDAKLDFGQCQEQVFEYLEGLQTQGRRALHKAKALR
jgi:hypothetical protein